MSFVNKSLDELIAEKKRSGRGGRGGNRYRKTTAGRGFPSGRGRGSSAPGRLAGRGRQSPVFGNAPARTRSKPYSTSTARFGRGRGGGGRGFSNAPEQRQLRVLVTGIPYDWKEQQVLTVMENAGSVEKLTIFWDTAGRPTGKAMCLYTNTRGADRAVEQLDGALLGMPQQLHRLYNQPLFWRTTQTEPMVRHKLAHIVSMHTAWRL
ncbi:hypothetical protein DIPPA_05613 [Diplonema papillatum]|nr:hypothetical protein DIPPA_05613 [Diplonema papillatum]